MNRYKYLNFILLSLFALSLVLGGTSEVRGHTGHKHEDGPSISLPNVVAKVNGTDIPKDSIMGELSFKVARQKAKGKKLSPEQEKSVAKQLINQEIGRRLVLQKAGELGITVAPDAVDKKLQAIKSKSRSEKAFKDKLARRNLTVEKFQKILTEDLIMEETLKKDLGSKIQISEADIKNYYDNNQDKFVSPEQVRASVILRKISRKGGEIKAQETMDKIVASIKGGKSFGHMAKMFSHDSLASKGGDLGFFTKDKMFGPFSKRAFKLKVGEMSAVFKTPHGLQILKVTDKKPSVKKPLDQERENIKSTLMSLELSKKLVGYVNALRKKADVKLYF